MGTSPPTIKVGKPLHKQEKVAWRNIGNFYRDEIERKRKQLYERVQKKDLALAADLAISIVADVWGLMPALVIGKAALAAYNEFRSSKNIEKAIKAGVQEGVTAIASDASATALTNAVGIKTKDFIGIIVKNALSKTFEEIYKKSRGEFNHEHRI